MIKYTILASKKHMDNKKLNTLININLIKQ